MACGDMRLAFSSYYGALSMAAYKEMGNVLR